MYVCMYGCMYGCMNGCMNGCMDVWMCGCVDVYTEKRVSSFLFQLLMDN